MGDRPIKAGAGALDVSDVDLESLAHSENPALYRAAQRVLREAAQSDDVVARFSSSI